jgi:hypothetical protein
MATLDLLDSNEAAGALAGTGTPDSTKLAMLNTAVSHLLDEICGPIVTRSVTRTVIAPSGAIWLDVPVGSPTFAISNLAVTEYTGGVGTTLAAETATVSTANDYRFDPTLGRLARRSSWYDTAWAGQEVLVVYIAGRFASTAAVGAKFKQAAKIALRHMWALEQGFGSLNEDVIVGGTGFAIPARALDLLRNETLPIGIA